MITRELFNKISQKYGYVASWAVWADGTDNPKSNMSEMEVLNPDTNKNLLSMLKNNVVMVGLNFSREVKFEKPFMNFHDANPYANDFKIRYAFRETAYYGAYMTDIIKNLPMVDSKDVLAYLKNNPKVTKENINLFREEMNDIGASKALLLAFGTDTYKLLSKYLVDSDFSKIVKLTHYSHFISKEKYREEVKSKLMAIDK